jgi:hypothetical protein
MPNLLRAISHEANDEEAAFWICMSIARQFPRGFEMAAKSMGFIPSAVAPRTMYPIAVAAMWEEANVNRTQRRKILRHLKAYFGWRFTAPEIEVTELGMGYY